MIKDIKYSGYSAVPSDYECQDGDLSLSLNLINENGALVAIRKPYVEMDNLDPKLQIVFIHNIPGSSNYILHNRVSGSLLWMEKGSGSTQPLASVEDFGHCNAVGNTLMIFTATEILYLLWEDNSYTLLGNKLPFVDLSFSLEGHPRLFSMTKGNKKFDVQLEKGVSESGLSEDLCEENQTKVTEQVMAKLNKFIREQTVEKGRFCFPFFVRYALRLYDGSLVCHSAPILMNPSTTPVPIITWERSTAGGSGYDMLRGCDIMLVAAALEYKMIFDTSHQRNILDKWKDIITSVDVFISAPIYTYDQSGKIKNIADVDNYSSRFIGRLFHESYIGNVPNFMIAPKEDNIFGTVNGTDFLNHYMEWPYDNIYSLYFSSDQRKFPRQTFHLPEFGDGKINESIENCCNFYKLCSLKLSDIKSSNRQLIPIEDDYLQSLLSREVMTDDYLTHDRLIADFSQSYNARLNLSGLRRDPFEGFSPASMFAYCDAAFSFTTNGAVATINVSPVKDTISLSVDIKEGGRTYRRLISSDGLAPYMMTRNITISSGDGQTSTLKEFPSFGAFLFYPNVNATRIIIRSSAGAENKTETAALEIPLKHHDFLNGSYALIPYNSERLHSYEISSDSTIIAPAEATIDCGNKVYTSEVNNPFFFPLQGINTVGSGKILGLSTAAKALSQGQFGQFPLYAFTDTGVWAMELSSTGTYSARQPITRDVCINPEGITQIDSAVLFPTARGIMLISGSQTRCITDTIANNRPFDLGTLPHLGKLSKIESLMPFSSFLADCRIIYDYVHQRIILYNSSDEHPYAYVYSLKSQLWGMMESQILDNVNSYPDALAITKSGQLVNFCKSSDDRVISLMLSRPLKLDAPDVLKTIDTIIQRGHFRNGHVQSLLYGSRDLYNWQLVWSSKDHRLRGFRGTPYKYFRIACVASLSEDESLFGASLQFTPRQTNQPR